MLAATIEGDAQFDKFSILTFISLGIFLVTIFLGTRNKTLYITLLPFVMIAFPSAVNDLSIGPYLGNENEIGSALAPIFTHIDLYLLLGFIAYGSQRIAQTNKSKLLLIILVILSIYFFATIVLTANIKDAALFAAGNYQIRFILWFIIFSYKLPEIFHARSISIGLAISILFLLPESIANTVLLDADRLTSGTLGNNVFGNIVAAITVYFIYLLQSHNKGGLYKHLITSTIVAGILIVLLSGTKMAIISLAAAYLLPKTLKLNPIQLITNTITGSIGVTLIILIASKFERYSTIPTIFSATINGDLALNSETSSIFTRFIINSASWEMLLHNPLIGIGVGRWNHYKAEYGVPFDLLLDPHNGYMSFLSQYGWVAGSSLILFYLAIPSLGFIKLTIRNKLTPETLLLVIPFALIFSEFTNANSLKIQVSALLSFVSVSLVHYKYRERLRTQGEN